MRTPIILALLIIFLFYGCKTLTPEEQKLRDERSYAYAWMKYQKTRTSSAWRQLQRCKAIIENRYGYTPSGSETRMQRALREQKEQQTKEFVDQKLGTGPGISDLDSIMDNLE